MSTQPLTEVEKAAARAIGGDFECTWHVGCDEGCNADRARAVVAAVRDLIATEERYAAADRLQALAPEQATPDAKDAFWRAAAITRSNPLSRPTSEEH
ncbi:hypothetical protein [Glycomyces sp. NPDC021274]|uniref:hypothetical protein n=1 Tax=Glycomyces sp. NPDC021274 TaxID=3155120 RepID=UPI0033F51CBD